MFKLAHISDPHLSAVPRLGFVDLASKRLLGFYNWRRNRLHAFGPAVLEALVADIHSSRPDHIAVTGDLVNLGLGEEIVAAGAWLRTVGSPTDTSLVPGNHDAYMPSSVPRFLREWAPYLLGDDASEVSFPFLRRRGPVAIIGVSSAVPTLPFLATGEIGSAQAAALGDILAATGREGLFRIVLVHHSPIKSATGWHRRLVDARLFRQALKHGGAELVVHGHNHVTNIGTLPGRTGPVPVVGVAAASVLPHDGRVGGSYLLFELEVASGFGCTMFERGVREVGGPVETLSEKKLF